MHKFTFVVHQEPDPEVFIKCFFGTDSKGLAQKIIRGEIQLPRTKMTNSEDGDREDSLCGTPCSLVLGMEVNAGGSNES